MANLRACAFLVLNLLFAGIGHAAVLQVNDGDDLQLALDRAVGGDVILLQAGATFVGDFVLPVKSGTTYITVRSAASAGLPASGERIGPQHATLLPKLQARSGPVLRTIAGSHHWRFENIEVLANPDRVAPIIALGALDSSQTSLTQVPRYLVFDRVYMHDDDGGSKRGIQLNSGNTDVVNSYIAGIRRIGQEAQAIAGWNGPGPFLIENNYLEGAGENVMFGGADPDIPELIPSDIVVRGNYITKPLSWKVGHPTYTGTHWTVKNAFELKNAQRVTIDHNVFENSWRDGQDGYLILFTGVNQDGRCTWCTVKDVTFTNNIVRHGNAGMQLIGHSGAAANIGPPGTNITVANNLFYDINEAWGDIAPIGGWLLIGGNISRLTVEHNTVQQVNRGKWSVAIASDAPLTGIVIRNNFFNRGAYGVFAGGAYGEGNSSIQGMFVNLVFQKNIMVNEAGSPPSYPATTEFISKIDFDSQFANVAVQDYTLIPASRYKNAATDGTDVGANMDALRSLLSGSSSGRSPVAPVNLRIVPK